MTLENINYIAQIVGVIAVVLSLGGVFVQLRHTAAQLRVQNASQQAERDRAAGQMFQSWFSLMRDDPEYARIIRVSAHHWPNMPDNPKFVAHMFWTTICLNLDGAERASTDGLAKPAFHDQTFEGLLGALMMPGLRQWWEENRYWTSPEFYAAVDARLAAPDAAVVPWHKIMPLWQASERDLAIIIADETARLANASSAAPLEPGA